MDLTPQFASSTNTDGQGNWSVNSATSVTPGFHQVLLRDQNGNESISPLYVAEGEPVFVVQQQTATQWLDRVQAVLPPSFAYALLGLILLLVLATLFIVWAGRRGSKRLAIILVLIVLTLTASGAIYLNWFVGVPSVTGPSTAAPAAERIDVRGSLQTPLGNQAVSGVDLTLGDTSIRTSGSGQFAFPNAYVGDSIRINHPMLKRAIAWRLSEGGQLLLPFDPGLFNALNDTLETSKGSISDQMLVITAAHTDVSKRTVTLETLIGAPASYTFHLTGDRWVYQP